MKTLNMRVIFDTYILSKHCHDLPLKLFYKVKYLHNHVIITQRLLEYLKSKNN